MSTQISLDKATLEILAAYNKEKRVPTYVIHTKAGDTSIYAGVSVRFIEFEEDELTSVILQHANNTYFYADLSEVTIRVQY